VAALLGLALFAFLLVLGDSFDPDQLYPDSVGALLLLVAFTSPFLALVALPVTGHVAASRAAVRPLRAGGIAAGTVAAVFVGPVLGLRTWTGGFDASLQELLSDLLSSVVLAGIAAGLVMVGAAVGARRHRVAR
jgi:hypothetical protein